MMEEPIRRWMQYNPKCYKCKFRGFKFMIDWQGMQWLLQTIWQKSFTFGIYFPLKNNFAYIHCSPLSFTFYAVQWFI